MSHVVSVLKFGTPVAAWLTYDAPAIRRAIVAAQGQRAQKNGLPREKSVGRIGQSSRGSKRDAWRFDIAIVFALVAAASRHDDRAAMRISLV
jgi:hypothetical protein